MFLGKEHDSSCITVHPMSACVLFSNSFIRRFRLFLGFKHYKQLSTELARSHISVCVSEDKLQQKPWSNGQEHFKWIPELPKPLPLPRVCLEALSDCDWPSWPGDPLLSPPPT